MKTYSLPEICKMCNNNIAIEMIDGSIIKVSEEIRYLSDEFFINGSFYNYIGIAAIYGLKPIRAFYAIRVMCVFAEAYVNEEAYTKYLKDNGIL